MSLFWFFFINSTLLLIEIDLPLSIWLLYLSSGLTRTLYVLLFYVILVIAILDLLKNVCESVLFITLRLLFFLIPWIFYSWEVFRRLKQYFLRSVLLFIMPSFYAVCLLLFELKSMSIKKCGVINLELLKLRCFIVEVLTPNKLIVFLFYSRLLIAR